MSKTLMDNTAPPPPSVSSLGLIHNIRRQHNAQNHNSIHKAPTAIDLAKRTAMEGPLNRRGMSMEEVTNMHFQRYQVKAPRNLQQTVPNKIGQISPTSAETHEPSTIATIAMNGASSAGTDNKYNLVMDSHIKYTNKSEGKGVNIRLVTLNPLVENDKSSPLVMTAIPTSVVASNGGKNQQRSLEIDIKPIINSLTGEIISAATTASVIKQVPAATIANSPGLDGVAADESQAMLDDDYHSSQQIFQSQEILKNQRASLVSDTNDGNDEENKSGFNGFDDVHLMEGVNVNNTSSIGNYLSDESQKNMLGHAQDFRNLEFAFAEMGTNGSAAISDGSGRRNISSTGGSDGEPTYECRHCGKKYRWKSSLNRHKNFECGDREPSYQCRYCPFKSRQSGNLGVHVRKHHSNLPQLSKALL